MKPIAIFRHNRTEGPGYFATFLQQHSIASRLIKVDEKESIPENVNDFAGLVFMGGAMSVNDDLPWIAKELRLIRAAVKEDIPVLGHCLGGQLIAKALGGVVTKNPVKEIGWGNVQVGRHPLARAWLGELEQFNSFHWHGEAFSIPPGATRIASSPYCENQMFALGKHLAMQCHVEMTQEMIATWCNGGAAEIAASPGPAVQSPETIRTVAPQQVPELNRVAERIYRRWIEGLPLA
jgi:GMP synthase-like glutamine amidotransferase